MTIYEALRQMRELSKEGKEFSFAFITYNRTNQSSHGIVEVNRARLRKRESYKYNKMSELQEAFINLDTNEPRRFWHCCLISFNGFNLTIV